MKSELRQSTEMAGMELTEQSRSRLEETKVEKRHEDEEYLRKHPEIAAAFRMLSKV